jgi:uncharacterized protein YdeI (BOF family)
MEKMKVVKALGAMLAFAAITLPLATPARAGYDETNERATDSRSSNRTRVRSSVRTTVIPVSGWTTVEGTLIEDADDKNFAVRDVWGRTINIETSRYAGAEATNKLQKGQRVRVYGEMEDGKLYATNLRVMTGMMTGTRIFYRNVYYKLGERNTIFGTLVSDADDDEFEIRTANGQQYMVRTRTIPDAYGLNKLQEGQRVQVYGYWIAEADGVQPQIEATNVRVIG